MMQRSLVKENLNLAAKLGKQRNRKCDKTVEAPVFFPAFGLNSKTTFWEFF